MGLRLLPSQRRKPPQKRPVILTEQQKRLYRILAGDSEASLHGSFLPVGESFSSFLEKADMRILKKLKSSRRLIHRISYDKAFVKVTLRLDDIPFLQQKLHAEGSATNSGDA